MIARLKSELGVTNIGDGRSAICRRATTSMSGRTSVYLRKARMEPQAECMLVLLGATPEGKKELIGFQTGVRGKRAKLEGAARRFEGARLGRRACKQPLATARSGFWKALDEAFPDDASSAMLAAQDI